jgi:hypothetical protein
VLHNKSELNGYLWLLIQILSAVEDTEPFLHVTQCWGISANEVLLLVFKVSSYYHQLALSQATGDKGPIGPGGFPPDPFQYLQAQVGPVGPRGPPGIVKSL